jgi:hypothetical protein
MEMLLLTHDDCDPCHDIEAKFKERFKALLDTKEAEIVNLDDNEEAMKWWAENDLPVGPVIVIMSENEEVVAVIETDKLFSAETDTAVSDEHR